MDLTATSAAEVARRTVLNSRFVQCLGPNREPQEWNPPAPIDELIDTWYFGRALAAMEQELQISGLTVYVTFDTEQLPSYGDDVVVVLIGDEWARVPKYLARVRVVFRNLCARPNLGCRPLAWPSRATFSSLLPAGRAAIRAAPGHLARLRAELAAARGRGRPPALQIELPVGTYNALDLPLTPFAQRKSDIFFAGSLFHKPGRAEHLKARVMPKTLTREAMLRNVDRLRRHREITVNLRLTEGFQQSAGSDAAEYSTAFMDSRLALVPRGAVTETHRFFQALKYGCIVVTDTVPPYWFYERAPIIRLQHWDELEGALVPLLAQPERLESLHRQALAWWKTACSEEAVGRLMASTINALG
jgi:hypothetical protein